MNAKASNPARLRGLALPLLAVPLATLPLSCAGTPPKDQTPAPVRVAQAIDQPERRLAALAELESIAPATPGASDADRRLDQARSMDPGFPGPLPTGSAEFRRATRPLVDVLTDLTVPEPISEIETPSADDQRRVDAALRQAVASLGAADPATAEQLMEEAVEIAPGSAPLWQRLGEARMALGDRAGAVDALTMAGELGSDEPLVLLTLASDAASRGESEQVIRWAGAAWGRSEPAPGEAAGPQRVIAGAMLGAALLERGDLFAAAQALDESAHALDTRPPRAGDPIEMTRLRAQRPELGLRLGDAWATLGQPARAAEAFRAALPADTRPTVPLSQRRLAALVASGRPATASIELLAHLQVWAGDLGPEESAWLRGLGRDPTAGPSARAAVANLIRSSEAPPAARRQLLRTLVRAGDNADDALAQSQAFPVLARSGVIASDILRKVPAADRVALATRAVAAHPAGARDWAAALIRLSSAPLDILAGLTDAPTAAEHSLALGMALELARPDLAPVLEPTPPDADPLLVATAAALAGHWDGQAARLDLAHAAAQADPTRRPALMLALIASQRLDEAQVLALAIDADTHASPEDLLFAAELALQQADFETAIARLDRASDIDPYDERIWERRIGLRSGETPVADEAETLALGREISERRPRSPLFVMLRAREMAGQGMLADAVGLLEAINDRDPSQDFGVQMIAQAVAAAGERNDVETPARARDWLEARAGALPGSVPLTLSLAQVRLTAGDAEGAYELLDAAAARIGHPELSRKAEAVLAQHLDRADEALTRALDRLTGPLGIDTALERGEVAAQSVRWPAVADAARTALPPDQGQLTQTQAARWHRIVFALIRSAETAGLAAETIALLDDAARRSVQLPPELVRGQLLLLARTGDTERLLAFVRDEPLGSDSGLIAVQSLLAAERLDEGLALLADLTLAGRGVYEDLFTEWARLAGAVGTADHTRAMIDRLDRDGRTAEAAAILAERFARAPLPGERTPARDRADIAYTTGIIASIFNRDDAAAAMHTLALEYDPRHAWAANDLGYALADRGESLDRAETLLSIAYETLPDEASVADSIGWVRYKAGVIEDETDAQGTVTRDGAITLLERASTMEGGRDNPTIFEHLGDALWRTGETERAVKSWTNAEQLCRNQIRIAAGMAEPNQAQIDRINEDLRRLRRRLNDAQAGREPEVAPIPSLDAEAGDTQPDPEPPENDDTQPQD